MKPTRILPPGCGDGLAYAACAAPTGWRVYAPVQPGIFKNRYCQRTPDRDRLKARISMAEMII